MYIGNQVTNVPFIVDSFNGNASSVSFGPLSRAPAGTPSIAVYVNGLYKTPSVDYTVAGTQIIFTTAPSSGTRNIIILHLGTGSIAGIPPDNSITTAKLADGSVTGPKIAPTAINAGNSIVAGSITGNLIAATSIRGNQIVASTITGNLIAATSIRGNQIVASTITGNLIADSAIRANQIVATSLTGNLFAANTITGDKIGQSAVSANNINPSAGIAITYGLVGPPNFQLFTAPGTFNIPSTTSRIKLTVVGAGGGSGGVRSGQNDTSSGQGGGGATTISYINVAASGFTTINVRVGVGGAGGFANASNQTSGLEGGASNVEIYASPGSPGGSRANISAVGGLGSPFINATPAVAITGGTGGGNVNSGIAGAGGAAYNSQLASAGFASGSDKITLFYDGFRGNIGSFTNANTGINVVTSAGQSYGLGTIGMGAQGVKAPAANTTATGNTGVPGGVLIEY